MHIWPNIQGIMQFCTQMNLRMSWNQLTESFSCPDRMGFTLSLANAVTGSSSDKGINSLSPRSVVAPLNSVTDIVVLRGTLL